MYTETIHFKEPRNVGRPQGFNVRGVAGDPAAGPFFIVYLDVDAESVIQHANFETYGCMAAVTAGSYLTESIKGQRIDDVALTPERLKEGLTGLPLSKEHCALLAVGALAHAIVAWKKRS